MSNTNPKVNTKTTSLRLPADLHARLEAQGKAEGGRSVGSILREAAEDYLKYAARR